MIKNNSIKNKLSINSQKSSNNLINNKIFANVDDEIIKKERYHRNNKILITERKNNNNDNYYKNYLLNKIDNSFNISSKLPNLKIKKTSTAMSPNTKFTQINVTKNMPKKQIFQKMNISKINSPVMLKRSNKLLQNKIDNNTDINKIGYQIMQNMNLNNQLNNSNNITYIQKQTSFNNSLGLNQFQISKDEQRKNSVGNNHSYHEIFSLSSRNSNTNTKAVYHNYSNNFGKKLNANNSANYISNIKSKFKMNQNIFNRKSSINAVQKPKTHNSQKIIYDPNNNRNIINISSSNQNYIEDNHIYYNEGYNEIDYNLRKKCYNYENKIKYYKIEKPIKYDNNCNIRYSNTVTFKNQNYSFQKYSEDGENIYYIYQENIPYRISPTFNNKNSHINYTYQNEINNIF